MNTLQIEKGLDSVVEHKTCPFYGVFARDMIPNDFPNYPAAIICNTDTRHNPGQHWVAFYFNSLISYEFFDSFGLHPLMYSFKFASPSTFNNQKIQTNNSNLCGQYSLLYLHKRTRGNSLHSILQCFSHSTIWNDKYVSKYSKHYFNLNYTPSLNTVHNPNHSNLRIQSCISFNNSEKKNECALIK